MGIPGGRQFALSVGGSSFFASASRKVFSSAAHFGVKTGSSAAFGAVDPAPKLIVQSPLQSGNELLEATPVDFAAASEPEVLAKEFAGGFAACPWHSGAVPTYTDNATRIVTNSEREHRMLSPFLKCRVAEFHAGARPMADVGRHCASKLTVCLNAYYSIWAVAVAPGRT